jgi:hypothetical protein
LAIDIAQHARGGLVNLIRKAKPRFVAVPG